MEVALLTGGSGFLRKHIVSKLSSQYIIHTLGRQKNNIYSVDLSTQIPELVANYDVVIHAAAKVHELPVNKKDEADFFAVNETGTRHLCEAFDRAAKYPKQFVFISTVAVYGLETGLLINESAPLKGTSPYAKSKINAELFLKDWCVRNNIILTIFRLPLVVAPDPPGNLGDMILAIKQNRYFNIGKGDAKRSMVLAEDVAAIIPSAAAVGGTYNLTDGANPTIAEIAEMIAKQLKRKPIKTIPYWLAKLFAYVGNVLGNYAPLNMPQLRKLTASLTFNDSKARQAFGWNPKRVIDHFTIN